MKKQITTTMSVIVTLMCLVPPPVTAQAAALSPDIIITELQTASTSATGEEFIELYNLTDHDIDLADSAHQGKDTWKIQFFSSTKVTANGINWDPNATGLTTISLTRSDGLPLIIPAHDYLLISTAGISAYRPGGVDPDLTYPSGRMSDSGGGVQLVDVVASSGSSVVTAHDHLGWFKPTDTVPLPAGLYLTPAAGGSLQRTLTNNSYLTADNTLLPFAASDRISPREGWALPIETVVIDPLQVEVTIPGQEVSVTDTDTSETLDESQPVLPSATLQLQPIEITELLPNPAAPQTDDKDEYIEIFNPNSQAVSLSGYTLQTGLKFSYSYTFNGQVIDPNAYLVLASGTTKLSLANSGGQARLLDNNGQTASQTAPYDTAASGQAWALHDNVWQWTTSPTPGAANTLTVSQPAAKPPAKASGKTTKLTSKPVTKTPVAKKPVKAASTAKPKTSPEQLAADDEANRPAPLHRAVLVGVGLIAVLYGAYEYRTDMGNKLYQFRRHRAARRALGQASEGAGSN